MHPFSGKLTNDKGLYEFSNQLVGIIELEYKCHCLKCNLRGQILGMEIHPCFSFFNKKSLKESNLLEDKKTYFLNPRRELDVPEEK